MTIINISLSTSSTSYHHHHHHHHYYHHHIIIIITTIIIDRAIRALGEIAMQIDSVSEEMTLALLQLIDMVGYLLPIMYQINSHILLYWLSVIIMYNLIKSITSYHHHHRHHNNNIIIIIIVTTTTSSSISSS
jgi:hypothetical protein